MKNFKPIATPRGGFALIITSTLMILFTILALGMLSLSSIALRTTANTTARSVAEANARMALMLALGDLQKNAGSDTRITARADILNESNPPVLGVWKSWEGTDHDGSGRPVSPGSYGIKKTRRFLAWLVSGDQTKVPDVMAGSGKATLVGAGSTTKPTLQIHLPTIPVGKSGNAGAYAWWVAGENMKSRLPIPDQPSSDSTGQWAAAMKFHATVEPKTFGLVSLLSDAGPAEKAIMRKQIDLIKSSSPPVSAEFFHDISATSVGLLTNAATGGWKKDLSLFTENQAKIGTSNLPLFRLTPQTDSITTLATPSNVWGTKSVFYPWSAYRGSTASPPIYQHAAAASWNNLIDYALLYKNVDSNATSIPTYSSSLAGNPYDFLHRVRRIPVIARIQWVYSHSAGPI